MSDEVRQRYKNALRLGLVLPLLEEEEGSA